MTRVRPCELPERALLREYRHGYVDCYVTEVPGEVSQAAFVEAFYTTPLFKVERAILRWLARRPSTDAEARKLAAGDGATFAAWRVELRGTGQLLLGDFTGRTKSWLMATPMQGAGAPRRTLLYFGSAVVPRVDPASGERRLGFPFRALLGFHKLYSRLLLSAARARLLAGAATP